MKYFKFLFSMSLTGALLLVFGVTIGIATFIENDFGAIGSQSMVYRALWFELLMTLMGVNMIGVIVIQRMWRREKLINLLFHSAFIVILIGAGITRFFGEEGMMHIREGGSSSTFISDNTYINTTILDGDNKKKFHDKVLFSRIKNNRYSNSVSLSSGKVHFKLKQFIFNATEIAEHNEETGRPMLTLVIAGNEGRENKFLSSGQIDNIGGMPISFNAIDEISSVQIMSSDSGLVLHAPYALNTMSMDTRLAAQIEPNTWVPVAYRTLYTFEGVNFVVSAYDPKAIFKIVSAPTQNSNQQTRDAIVMEVSGFGESKEVLLFGGRGYEPDPNFLVLGGVNMSLSYGSRKVEVPFKVELKDFQLDRYPGSMSPSSFASEVIVHDAETNFPFRIYMNNVLDYRGYRFFQSSYDQDELGTVLSVNKDRPGTWVSYIGYMMLAIGLIAILFSKNTRFSQLSNMIDTVHKQRQALPSVLLLILLFTSVTTIGQNYPDVPSVERAEAFGKVIYQSNAGRMAPINTLANDLLRKIYKTNSMNGYTAEQVVLAMMSNPHEWQKVDMIQVDYAELRSQLKIESNYASFDDFFGDDNNYIFLDEVNAAYAKKPSMRDKMDKELINVDERLNICYMIYQGSLLKIFPVPNDADNHWVAPLDKEFYGLTGGDSTFVRNATYEYFRSLSTNDFEMADKILVGIKKYQSTFGSAVLPNPTKVDFEIKFNNWNVFEKLFPYYLLVGFSLLVVLFIKILSANLSLKWLINVLSIMIFAGFLAHTIGLGIRWYISGHAPWSNGYEATIYIGWAGLLAGFVFRKKSPMTLAVTAVLGGIILFVANLSFLDPQITNLVPVLKSYWLTIHVSAITASYGFMALGALLAFVNLITMIFKTSKNQLRLSLSIKELTYVIEMTLTIGLVLLSIGNFLGGVWANESWGRYWGWDPKETWALASIIFYAFVLHMRFIPGLKSIYTFNFSSLIAFASIIMTFYGVNYYLSGLHSYAAGDPVPIPTFVYYSIAVIAFVSLAAYWNNNRLTTSELTEE